MRNNRFLFILLLLGTLLPACSSLATEEAAPTEPITANFGTDDLFSLDPQLDNSFDKVESLFVNLTNYSPPADVVPEAATSWEISADGLTYTFHLRTDIPWVQHNPTTGETTQVLDGDGQPRFVTSEDFAYGIKRACEPSLGSYYSTVIAPIIKGCEAVLFAEEDTDEADLNSLRAAIGVQAPADDLLIIELAVPASFFMQMTPMWTLAAAPSWAIETHGDDWTKVENIVTNGRYVLQEWTPGIRYIFQRNPLIPKDMAGTGNIDKFHFQVVPDITTEYALWLKNEVDFSGIPFGELLTHQERFPDETLEYVSPATFYIGFVTTKPPFDNPQVRRAFSAAIDRQTLIDQIFQGQGQPMKHLAPPGIFGAPPIDEVGVGYDPDFAREQLAAAGYPDCEGFPEVTMIIFGGPEEINEFEFYQSNWAETLGCQIEQLQLQQMSFDILLQQIDPDLPLELAPHMWKLGWGADYADENNWVGDVLWCQNEGSGFRRTCSGLDDLIVEARQETGPQRRIALYRQIEEGFFGPEGETPLIPLHSAEETYAKHTWIEFEEGVPIGALKMYNWRIDWAVKQAAQQE